jgi:hypothetical protein
MDRRKCDQLKARLSAQAEPQVIPIEIFLDGNDDLASIGCNLLPHPGIDAFRSAVFGLLERPDVLAVYALIAEVDPGEEFWPFTDTVLVAGTIPPEELARALAHLEPDEIAPPGPSIPDAIAQRHGAPLLVAWWD